MITFSLKIRNKKDTPKSISECLILHWRAFLLRGMLWWLRK